MKTTLDISDALFRRAKARAKATGQPLRALVEEGLRRVLDTPEPARPFRLRRDLAVGPPYDPSNPLPYPTPEELKELRYGTELDQLERIMGTEYVQRHAPELKRAKRGAR